MKNLRITLVSLAFVMAMGASYAHNSVYKRAVSKANTTWKYGNFVSGCKVGVLNQYDWECTTTQTTYGRCSVSLGFETKDAWDMINIGGLCAVPVYRSLP